MPLCCIFGCETNLFSEKMRKFVKFYRFPSVEKEPERREVWIKRINKKVNNGKGSGLGNDSLVCERHFVNNYKSDNSDSLSFNPTLCLNEDTVQRHVAGKRQAEDWDEPAKTAKLVKEGESEEVLGLQSSDLPFIAVQSITTAQHPQPDARWGHSMSMVGEQTVLVLGGQGSLGDVCKDCLWKLDLSQAKWFDLSRSLSGTRPGVRIGHTSVYDPLLRCMYVFGGMRRRRWCAGLYAFDTDHYTWTLLQETSSNQATQSTNAEDRLLSSSSSSSSSTTSTTTTISTPTTTYSFELNKLQLTPPTTSSSHATTTTTSSSHATTTTTPASTKAPHDTTAVHTMPTHMTTTTSNKTQPPPLQPLNTDKASPPQQLTVSSTQPPQNGPSKHHQRTLIHEPPLLSYHSCVSYKQHLFFYGGTTPAGQHEVCSDQLYVFDCLRQEWSRPVSHGNIPPKRSGHSGSLIKNKMVVFGGWDDPVCFNDTHVLDLDSLVWCQPKMSGPVPSPRSWHSSCLLSRNRVLIHGGFSGHTALNDMFVLNIELQQWTSIFLQPCLSIRAGHSAICLPYRHENQARDQVLMLGGGDNDDRFYNHLINVMVPIS